MKTFLHQYGVGRVASGPALDVRGSVDVTVPDLDQRNLVPAKSVAVPHLDVRYARRIPAITANTCDPAWRDAALVTALTMSVGPAAEGIDPVPTTIGLLWHATGLFVRFTCRDDDPYAPFVGRDQPHHKGDVCEVFIDVAGDAQRWIEVQITPTNQILDKCFARPRGVGSRHIVGDLGYSIPGLRSATRLTDDGWIADLLIPAAAMWPDEARPALGPGTIRANLLRYDWVQQPDDSRRLIAMNWSPVAWGMPHLSPHRMGYLHLHR